MVRTPGICVHDEIIFKVKHYIYLSQTFAKGKENQELVIDRRIRFIWAAFRNEKYLRYGTKIWSLQSVHSAFCFICETWVPTKTITNKLQVTRKAMQRKIFRNTLKYRRSNKWIRTRLKIQDMIARANKFQWEWVDHIIRRLNRWSEKIICRWP